MGEDDSVHNIPNSVLVKLERRARADGLPVDQLITEAFVLYLLIREKDDAGMAFAFIDRGPVPDPPADLANRVMERLLKKGLVN